METWKEVTLALIKKFEEAVLSSATPMDAMEANEDLNAYFASAVEAEQGEQSGDEDPE